MYDIVKFLQLKFTKDGLQMTPSLPRDEYKITTKLVGYSQTKDRITGYYKPLVNGTYKVEMDLVNVGCTFRKLKVNGIETPANFSGSKVSFEGTADGSLTWELS